MRIYLNVSCLNRPFDDQEQTRIRLEAAAVGMIFERFDAGDWVHVSSEIAMIEIDATADARRRERVRLLLPESGQIVMLSPEIIARGEAITKLGFKSADALHVASAEARKADVLLSCDDRFCKTAERQASELRVAVWNPLDWLGEVEDATHAR